MDTMAYPPVNLDMKDNVVRAGLLRDSTPHGFILRDTKLIARKRCILRETAFAQWIGHSCPKRIDEDNLAEILAVVTRQSLSRHSMMSINACRGWRQTSPLSSAISLHC